METRPVQFAGQSYVAKSPAASSERLVNWFLEPNPEGAKCPFTLYPTSGLNLLTTIGSGPCRGFVVMDGGGNDLYIVSGTELYVIRPDLSSVLLGTIPGSGSVRMTQNGTHVAIAPLGGPLYIANRTYFSSLPYVFNSAFFQDGYAIYTQANSLNFWWSDLDDMTTINGLSFNTADAQPDLLIGGISDRREIWFLKERTIENWYNSGAPFARAPGGFVERGCIATGSIAHAEGRVIFLGDDRQVYAMQGYTPTPISTPAINELIRNVVSPSSAEAMVFQEAGHTCYALTFADLTIVYDFKTGRWYERASYGMNRWRANGHVYWQGMNIVGDYVNGKIYELDPDTYDEDGDVLPRTAVSSVFHGGGNRVGIPYLYIDMETGNGLVSGQGSAPQAMLDWSDDGGVTWIGQRVADIGAVGLRNARATFSRLGSFYQRDFRLTISDPIKTAIFAAYASVETFAK